MDGECHQYLLLGGGQWWNCRGGFLWSEGPLFQSGDGLASLHGDDLVLANEGGSLSYCAPLQVVLVSLHNSLIWFNLFPAFSEFPSSLICSWEPWRRSLPVQRKLLWQVLARRHQKWLRLALLSSPSQILINFLGSDMEWNRRKPHPDGSRLLRPWDLSGDHRHHRKQLWVQSPRAGNYRGLGCLQFAGHLCCLCLRYTRRGDKEVGGGKIKSSFVLMCRHKLWFMSTFEPTLSIYHCLTLKEEHFTKSSNDKTEIWSVQRSMNMYWKGRDDDASYSST